MTRYDYVKEGSVKDIDGDLFPDVLSYNYNKFLQTEDVTVKEIKINDLTKFWKWSFRLYKDIGIGDIVLSLNNIQWRGDIQVEDIIVTPSVNDIFAMIPASGEGSQAL